MISVVARQNPAWHGVLAMLALALSVIAYLAVQEFGPRSGQAIQVDELYFASCAARGLATDQVPVAGCHDNKGPVIFLVHQLVQLASAPYDLRAIKIAAFAVVLMVAAGAGLVAHGLAGWVGALAAAALVLQALATSTPHLALKTETVGAVFVLTSLAVLIGNAEHRTPSRLVVGGFLMGLAVMTKQTNAVAGLAVILWFATLARGGLKRPAGSWIADTLAFCAGLVTPFLLFFLVFLADGRHLEFLSAYFIYPSVYGASGTDPVYKRLVWKSAAILSNLAAKPLLSTLFVLASIGVVAGSLRGPADSRSRVAPRLLILLITLAMMLAVMISPNFYSYHIIPVEVPMAVLGGLLVADLGLASRALLPEAGRWFSVGLMVPSVLVAASSWHGAGANNPGQAPTIMQSSIKESRGDYAYVLGMWPGFYAHNGLVPASNVMFPWALPEMPRTALYEPPPTASVRGHLLAWAHRHNQARLWSDFRRTPPKFIVVIHHMAAGVGSRQISDMPGFDEYLHRSCSYMGPAQPQPGRDASLYRCNGDLRAQYTEPKR